MTRVLSPPRAPRLLSLTLPLLSSAVGLAPGMVLPFLVAARMTSDVADLFLLAYSIAITLTNIVANTVEQNTIAEYGRFDGLSSTPSSSAWKRYTRSTRTFTATVVLLGFPVILALYGAASQQFYQLTLAALPLLAVPILGSIAAERSARVIVHGRINITILLQSCRAAVPLTVLFLFPSAAVWVVTSAITIGELLRLLGLSLVLRRVGKPFDASVRRGRPIESRGLWWQASSMVTSQAGSVTDRAFLGAAPAGSVAAYEMSDKILYAGVQVLVSGLLLRTVPKWARAAEGTSSEFSHLLRRHLFPIFVFALVGALLAIGSIELILTTGLVNPAWATGLRWGQLALLSMPLSVLMTALGRVLVILRKQRLLVPLVILGLSSNLVLDLIFFGPFGGFGILLSSILSRVIGAAAYLLFVVLVIKNWKQNEMGKV